MAERLFELDDALPGVRLHGHHGDAEFLGELRGIEAQAGFFRDVHHVQHQHAGQSQLDDLKGELEVALKVGGIHDANGEVRFCGSGQLAVECVERDFLIR